MKSLFTEIYSSSHTVVSSAQVVYFFNLFLYFIVIANIFVFKSIAWNLLSQISCSVSVSVIPFPFPDSMFWCCHQITVHVTLHDTKAIDKY